ncbi:glycosyltransferase family 2 protein [Acidovorax sp. M14]|uniref:glycosyltransferase family 2 protein n=1 Tax=Acidovorax sp. M14 TaxID=3411354 RepID=UPI003BF5A42D
MQQITTIIPTYRRPIFLRRAIKSALEQKNVTLQVCVYDNCSEDETEKVVRDLAKEDERIFYYCHSKNIGGLANFLYGMSEVETEFFSFLSDDDYLLPGFYQHAIAALDNYPEAMCWAGMTLNVDEDNLIWDARVRQWPREGVFEPPEGFMAMTGGMAPLWTGILFRKDVLKKVGLIDPKILGPSDLEYCLRLAARYPYILEKYPAAVLTLNSQSYSATQPMTAFWPGWKYMFEKISSDPDLSAAFKHAALAALRRDGRKMLFRRGANAVAAGRLDFVRDAANALAGDCDEAARAFLLRSLAVGCSRSSDFQRIYTLAYRWAERRIVDSRQDLQTAYGHLLQPI